MSKKINENDQVNFYNRLPAKRTGGGVLIFNAGGDLLLVKPTYRNTWTWPGGGSDPNEPPLATAIRECKEELGIMPGPLSPAFVNYVPSRPDGTLDVVHFAYAMEPVGSDFIKTLKLPADEIEMAKFVPVSDIGDYMKEYRVRAIRSYLKHRLPGGMLYLEDGRLV